MTISDLASNTVIQPYTFHGSKKQPVLAVIALLCCAGVSNAATFKYNGSLPNANEVFELSFTVTSPTDVTLQTTSWGTGNFDPVMWLFDSAGNQVVKNDDACNGQGCSPINRDSLIQETALAAGTYTAIVSTYDQHFWRAGAAGNPPGVLVSGWSYNGNFSGLPPNYAVVLTTNQNIATPITQTMFPPSDTGPAAPTLISPPSETTAVPAIATLTWNTVSGTNGYTIYIGTANPPTNWSGQSSGSSFTTPSSLAAGTLYYWRVASRDPNNANTENSSAVWTFTTAAGQPPPAAPVLVSPVNGAAGLPWLTTLSWNSVSGSNGYNVYFGSTNPPTTSTFTTNPSYSPPAALTPGATYYWKVASRDPNKNNAETSSAVASFTTSAQLPAPTLLSPNTGSAALSASTSLNWSAVNGSSGYTVYLGTTNPPTTGTLSNGTSFAPTLTQGSTYFWRVASRDANNGNFESLSSIWVFSVASALPAPTLASPASGATKVVTTPTLSWNAVSGTSGYTVYLGTTNPPVTGVSVMAASYTPSSPLTAGVTYYWMAASRDPNNNNKEATSAVWSFTTASPGPAVPTLSFPANGATGVALTAGLSWNAVSGTAGYSVYLGTTNPPSLVAQPSGTTYTASTALSPGTQYYWMVASRDPNNNNKESPSAVWSFTTAYPAMPAPTLTWPSNGAKNVVANTSLTWSAVTGSAGYSVYLGTTNPPTTATQVSGLSFTPASLSPGVTYFWMAASRDPNNNNKEADSAVWSFTTTAPPPAGPTLLSPANGATGVPVTAGLSWNAVTGTAGYSLYLGTTNPPPITTQPGGTTYTPSAALSPGTQYYWMVASRDPNNNNKETPSAVWSFTTAYAPLSAPTLLSPLNGAKSVAVNTSLTWNAVTGSAGYSVYFGTTNPPSTVTQISGLAFAPSTLSTAVTYYWMVASRDPHNNNKEAASAVWSFTTAAPPVPAPTLVSPTNGATGILPGTSLSWNVVSATAGYNVYLGTTNPPQSATFTSSTSFAPVSALTSGTKYYWYVTSRDPNNNNKEAASPVWSFTTAPFPAPTLTSPTDGATGVAVSTSLTWTSVPNSAGYSVYLGSSNPPTTQYISFGTSFTPYTVLSAGTKYYWYVSSHDLINGFKESPSAIASFTTASGFAAPGPLTPSNGATGVSVNTSFSWSAVSGTSGYVMYLGTANPPTAGVNLSGTSYTPPAPLAAGTTYYWYVASKDPNNGNKQAPSSVWTFTTVSAFPSPILNSPPNGAAGMPTTISFSWIPIPGSAGYNVYLGTSNPPVTSTYSSVTSFTPTGLTGGTTYYWYVASRDPGNNNKQSASPIWSFTTVTVMSAPLETSPANAAAGVPIKTSLNWGGVSGSNGYTVYLGTSNPPTTGTFAAGTSFSPSAPLNGGVTYYWYVASRDPNSGNRETASPVWSFTTSSPVLAPTLLSPANNATAITTGASLSWIPVSGSAGYSVYLDTANPPAASTQAINSPFTPATALVPGTKYYWMVASRDPNNNNQELNSPVWSFTTAPASVYSSRRIVTINHTQVPNTDQANFPFLFDTTDALLRTTVNGGHVTNASGFDLIFTSDAAGTQKLDHEIEYYNGATGQLVVWVRIPSLSHSTDTVIYMFYGNATVAVSQENKTGVWDGSYRAVYHMADDAANINVTDSTTNHPASNQVNTNTRATQGQVDGALTFNGTSDFATASDAVDLQSSNVKTVSFWMKPSDLSGADTYRVISEYTDPNNYWAIVEETAGNADFNTIRADMKVAGTDLHLKIADNSLTPNTFYHVTAVFSNSVPSAIYLNGISRPLLTPNQGQLGYGTAPRMTIGARNDNAHDFPGVLDEVRISTVVRSADWIGAEYNNQASPGTFYSLSGESNAGQAQ